MKRLTIYLVVIIFAITNVSISTYAQNETGTFKDIRDGKSYKTVTIGTQVWMAENLAYKTSSGSLAYNNSESNVAKYGRLYNWETAKTVCPTGWHLPSDTEWATLTNYLGGEKVAGKKLKSSTGWDLYKGKNYGKNKSGFSAPPAGYRRIVLRSFCYLGERAYFWTSTPNSSEYAWGRYLHYYYRRVVRSYYDRTFDFSVRCLRN